MTAIRSSILTFGSVPVPFTAGWTGEETFYVGICPIIGMKAICQESAPGSGKPTFAKPHWIRQRQAIHKELCDICGKPLKGRTKVSLSHASPRTNGAEGLCILQVEPLCHKECASIALKHCPSLQRDIEAGTLFVRQVSSYRKQYAISAPEHVDKYVPGYVASPIERIIGHAKIELLKWRARDVDWVIR